MGYLAEISATDVAGPVLLTVAEEAERIRKFLLRVSSLWPEWFDDLATHSGGSTVSYEAHERWEVDISDPSGFAEQFLEFLFRSFKFGPRRPAGKTVDGAEVLLSLDSFANGLSIRYWLRPNNRNYIDFSVGGRRVRGVSLRLEAMSDDDVYRFEDELLDYWSPRRLHTSRCARVWPGRMEIFDALHKATGTKSNYFYDRDWHHRLGHIEGLPPEASQTQRKGGTHVVHHLRPDDEGYVESAVRIGTAIGAARSVLTEPADHLPHRLSQWSIDGVPVDRQNRDVLEPLYWVVRNSLERDLDGTELAKLVELAERQAALKTPGPIEWLVEGEHVRRQLEGALEHLSDRITVR